MVFLTLAGSVYMFTINTLDYLTSKTRTTLETSTETISEVVFPSVTVCNMVQVVSSFTLRVCKEWVEWHHSPSQGLKGWFDIASFQIIPRGNVTQITALYAQYINGKDPIPNQQQVLSEIEWLKTVDVLYSNRSLSSYAHQSCSDLIFAIKYQEIQSEL